MLRKSFQPKLTPPESLFPHFFKSLIYFPQNLAYLRRSRFLLLDFRSLFWISISGAVCVFGVLIYWGFESRFRSFVFESGSGFAIGLSLGFVSKFWFGVCVWSEFGSLDLSFFFDLFFSIPSVSIYKGTYRGLGSQTMIQWYEGLRV